MAKASIHFAVTPDVMANLVTVFARGTMEGVDYMRHGKASRSALLRDAIERGAKSCAVTLSVAAALPERTGTADADRLKAAQGKMTDAACANAAGLKDESSVRNVRRGMALKGKLLTWVEQREAEVGT